MDHFDIDPEYGGFMCTVDIFLGKQISSDKRAWFEGRGISEGDFQAAHRKDTVLFHASLNAFERYIKVASDAVYGSYFR